MLITAKSDRGLVRKQNQDSFAAGELPGEVFWAVVCDGMGGAQGGSVASKIGVDIISDKIKKGFNVAMGGNSVKNLMTAAIEGSNIKIFDMAKKDDKLTGMGTTVVTVIVHEKKAYFAHAGDSRAYIVNGSGIRQITSDHSIVQAMVENGELTPDEAKKHPQRNIITRALGVEETIDVDFNQETIKNDELIIVCTDGLTNFVEPAKIFEIYLSCDNAVLAENLVTAANENGGGDNITVVVLANTTEGA